jgi:hypothetical protein
MKPKAPKKELNIITGDVIYIQMGGNQISIDTKKMPERYVRVVWDGKKLTPQFSNDLKTWH